MSEFEAATIAFQEATIAYQNANLATQQAGLAIAEQGNKILLMQAGVAGFVGLVQAGILAWGIRTMGKLSAKREEQHADRHAETMEVLKQQGEALRQQGEALHVLVERTAPRS